MPKSQKNNSSRKNINRSRSSRGYGDRNSTKGRRGKPHRRFLIVCEGQETEPNYFEALGKEIKNKVNLIIKREGKVTLSLVQEAKRLKDEDEKDEVWCVFDRDFKQEPNNQQNFNEAISLAIKNNIHLAISNDAFELWFLLHYEYYSSQTHRSELIKKLSHKNRLGAKYQKNSEDMYEILKNKQQTAIDNAQRLWDNCNQDYNMNPSTTVFQLVNKLKRSIKLKE